MTVFDERPLTSLSRDGSILPEGWSETPLSEVVIHKIGGEWGEEAPAEGFIPVSVVRGTEFRAWGRDKGSTAAERWIKASRLTSRQLLPGDFVVEISGGGPGQPVGRTLLIDSEAIALARYPLICGNFCRLLRLHSALDPAFVHLALREKYLRGDVWHFQNQTTNLRNLQFDEYLDGTLLRVPPLYEQRRIAAAVEELLARAGTVCDGLRAGRRSLRRSRQAVLAAGAEGRLTEAWRRGRSAAEPALEALARIFEERQKSFDSAAGQARLSGRRSPKNPFNLEPGAWQVPEPLSLPAVPDGWTLAPLQDLVEGLQYGTSKKADKNLKDGVPVLRMGNIRDGAIDLSDLKMIDPAAEDIPKFLLRRGDILFNRTNSPELVGKAAVFDYDRQAIFASYLVRIVCDQRLVLPEYLCGWINSPWGRQWARAVRTDCVSQSNINASKLRTMPVPLPPIEEQREIVRLTREAWVLADAVDRAIDHALGEAERLPRAILERAMRGELVPTEAELARLDGRSYEPAVIILDRIRADRPAPPPETEERKPRLRSLPGLSIEGVLAAIRRTSWGGAERTDEELIEAVAARLKLSDPSPEMCGELGRHIEIAVERLILARKGERLVGITPKIGRYEEEFLLGVLGRVMREGIACDRKKLSRMVASWLGYDQVTAAIRDRLDDIFQLAVRRGLLAFDGDVYSLIHSKSS